MLRMGPSLSPASAAERELEEGKESAAPPYPNVSVVIVLNQLSA